MKEETNNKCEYNLAWMGACNKPTKDGEYLCDEHLEMQCIECGDQAVRECTYASSLSCASPICKNEECLIKHNQHHY